MAKKHQHPKYKIKESDTLQSITELFNIEKTVWIQYHNNMCQLDDIIQECLPGHLEEIYLLPELWENVDDFNSTNQTRHALFNEQEEIILYNKNILFFAPYNINNRYGVIIDLGENRIHYEVEIKYIGHLTPDVFRISIDRKQVYINNQEPHFKLYEMADQMAKSIYPLILDINKEKKIQAIANYQDIRQRSTDVQKRLSQYFVGEYANKYIQTFKKHVNNPNTLINHLENELFYQLFFLPIQGLYDEQLTRKTQYSHLSEMNTITIYDLNVELNHRYTESGKIIAKIHSTEVLDANISFEAEYRLYPEDHSIFSMRGNLILLNDKNKACNTHFEIYHLNTSERIIKRGIINHKKLSSIKGQQEKTSNALKKQKRIWNIFK